MQPDLDRTRAAIDRADRLLLRVLELRQRRIAEIAALKRDGEALLRDVPREEDVLTRVATRARELGLDPFFATRLFREVLDQSVRTQQAALRGAGQGVRARSVVVGSLGGEGSWSHLAAQRHFGARALDAIHRGFDGFDDMLEALRARAIDYAVLPLENSATGSLREAWDLLARMDLALVGEEVQPADHCLVGIEDVPLSRVQRILSHPQALAQCRRFLARMRHCRVEIDRSTALAVKRIREVGDPSQAAIASEEAARLHGAVVLARGLADHPDNFTRMGIVATQPEEQDLRVACKTSLLFATRHEEGALARALQVFAAHRLSLTKLESRPRPGAPWEYLFLADFEGNVADPETAAALRELTLATSFLKVLGSYPARSLRAAQPAQPRAWSAGPRQAPATNGSGNGASPPAPAAAEGPPRLVLRAQRPQDTVIRVGSAEFGGAEPVVIAGPCAVETREQVLACARIVKEAGGHLLRGGCFKPRTSPYSFQGHGFEALDMLAEAGREVGLPIVTEVMSPADADRIAEKCDVLQVGARNMQNFSLLKALGRVDRPVLLKRGLMSSIDEWLDAAEYLLAQGNPSVILCERGIRTFERATRNTLDLSAVPVVRERTHLPIVVDPSHAVGVARWIPVMAEAALASGAHGLMLEIHPDPARALSDGPQALTFEAFRAFMRRNGTGPGALAASG